MENIVQVISTKEIKEMIALFEQFKEWGWRGAAYSVARDMNRIDPEDIPTRLTDKYREMESYRTNYLDAMVDSTYVTPL